MTYTPDEAKIAQQKFSGATPETTSYEDIIRYIGYITEETIEARMRVPRRPWRNETIDRPGLLEELVDVHIWLMNTVALSGFTTEDWENAITSKLNKNKVRTDWVGLGDK